MKITPDMILKLKNLGDAALLVNNALEAKVQEIRQRKIELEEKYRDCKREANIVKKRQEVAHEYYVAKKEFANRLTVKSLI